MLRNLKLFVFWNVFGFFYTIRHIFYSCIHFRYSWRVFSPVIKNNDFGNFWIPKMLKYRFYICNIQQRIFSKRVKFKYWNIAYLPTSNILILNRFQNNTYPYYHIYLHTIVIPFCNFSSYANVHHKKMYLRYYSSN